MEKFGTKFDDVMDIFIGVPSTNGPVTPEMVADAIDCYIEQEKSIAV